jgi:cytochrome c-type biogenesis protein CcmH/NrfG
LILAAHGRFEDARRALETAVALGAHSPEAWYALADSTLRSGPGHIDAADAAIAQAMKAAPDDPHTRELAARIAAQKSHSGAVPGQEVAGARDGAPDPAKLFLIRPPRDW